MKCNNCGFIMDPTDLYCEQCGTKAVKSLSIEESGGMQLLEEQIEQAPTLLTEHQGKEVQIIPNARRKAIPFSFGAAIFCFLLPFLDLKCGGTQIVSYSGLDLVVGKDMPNGDMFGERREESQVPPNIWAILALGSSIVGFYVFLSRQKNDLTTGKIAAILGFAALIILQITIRNSSQLHTEGAEGVITINFLIGYWGCLLAIATAGILCHMILQEKSLGASKN